MAYDLEFMSSFPPRLQGETVNLNLFTSYQILLNSLLCGQKNLSPLHER